MSEMSEINFGIGDRVYVDFKTHCEPGVITYIVDTAENYNYLDDEAYHREGRLTEHELGVHVNGVLHVFYIYRNDDGWEPHELVFTDANKSLLIDILKHRIDTLVGNLRDLYDVL